MEESTRLIAEVINGEVVIKVHGSKIRLIQTWQENNPTRQE